MKVLDELSLLSINDAIKNIVPPMRAIPGSPNTKESPGLGKEPADNSVATVNTIATIKGILISFRKKVTAKKNNEIGILKYCIPPQEAFARPNSNPPTNALAMATFCLCFNAEISKYRPRSARNKPRGSDLNHPKFPR